LRCSSRSRHIARGRRRIARVTEITGFATVSERSVDALTALLVEPIVLRPSRL
jgi:hypothetical protein